MKPSDETFPVRDRFQPPRMTSIPMQRALRVYAAMKEHYEVVMPLDDIRARGGFTVEEVEQFAPAAGKCSICGQSRWLRYECTVTIRSREGDVLFSETSPAFCGDCARNGTKEMTGLFDELRTSKIVAT